MTVRVAVVDPLPMFARGLAATLGDEGFPADAPEDVLQWAAEPGVPLVLLAVEHDRDWARLSDLLKVQPEATVVVVLSDVTPGAYVRAVAAGAVGVLPRDASAILVRDVVRAAVNGNSLLPVDVLRTLVANSTDDQPPRLLSDNEIEWLSQLADGMTVAQLAERVGYSERMMFRLLSGLYSRLGVGNRTRALMRAREEGWL
ncbi:response regulator transcription factor [Nonomuraea sp. NPDC049784]|uniref:response regulator transcription factor n=1 Tax=Nonomuraea sp. NPDC049784 TaxID=3154361 RepID=UPI0034036A20